MAKKKSKRNTIIIISFLSIIVIVIVWLVWKSSDDKTIQVTVENAGHRTITQMVSAIGTIRPETEVKISSETSGEITYLAVKEGDTVRQGELLVRINPDIIQTQLDQFRAASNAAQMGIEVAKAEMERSESELKRLKDLYAKGYISQQDFDRAKTTYDQSVSHYKSSLSSYNQSVAALKQFQVSASKTTINSPINGIVTSLNVEKGEKVVGTAQMQGTEMMKIADLKVMNAMVDVDENDIILVKIGDTVKIEVDAIPDSIYLGYVIEIGHSAKATALGSQDQVTNFEVKVRFIDYVPALRPGMSCNVDIQTETHYNVLAVPLMAVTTRSDTGNNPDANGDNGFGARKVNDEDKIKKKVKPQTIVFLKDGNKAKKKKVETGLSDKGYIEITSGLKKGDAVISGGYSAVSKELKDGSEIAIDTASKKFKNFKK